MTDIEKKMLTIFNFYFKDINIENLTVRQNKIEENIKSLNYKIFKVEKEQNPIVKSEKTTDVRQFICYSDPKSLKVGEIESETNDKNDSTFLEKDAQMQIKEEIRSSTIIVEKDIINYNVYENVRSFLNETLQMNSMVLFNLRDTCNDIYVTNDLLDLVTSRYLHSLRRDNTLGSK